MPRRGEAAERDPSRRSRGRPVVDDVAPTALELPRIRPVGRWPAARAWVVPMLGVGCCLVAGSLNVGELASGRRPSMLGVAWSAAYLALWLAYAVQAGRSRNSRHLRCTAMCWAVVISGTVLCGTLLRLSPGTEGAVPGGWAMMLALLVAVAPFYGLVGPFPAEPTIVLPGIACGAAVLVLGLALAARLHDPTRTDRAAG